MYTVAMHKRHLYIVFCHIHPFDHHLILVSGNFIVLAALLEAGCPANSPDIHGVYPLHYAVNESREPLPTGEKKRKREKRYK